VKFKKDFLRYELDLPHSAKENRIIDNSRWSISHEIIFEHEGKFYQTYYSVGATEQQDESPWEYEDEVECVEVQQVEKVVKVWEPVQ
jgi:hypothetical protein